MKKKLLCAAFAVICLLSLTACKEETKAETVSTTAATLPQTTEAVPETTAEATESATPVLLADNVDGKVCVGFIPTEVGNWRYAVIEDQDAAVAAFEKAVGAIYSNEWWNKGDKTTGMMVAYGGEFWDFVDSGELVCAIGRVKAEDAADLLALCTAAAREAGWKLAVTPEQLTGIAAATLRVSGKELPLTDGAALDKLEVMLSGGKFSLGVSNCPFTARLDLEMETGEKQTIALATDSCGVWMSEGNCYDYGSDSQSLYDLFGVTLKFGEILE